MKLSEFPQAIAYSQTENLKAEQAVRHWQSQVDRAIAAIEQAIAFDKSLTNEAQRKATRIEMMGQPEVQTALETLQLVQGQKTERTIGLELLRNQFSVAKLAERKRIAELEAALA
jgi:predicted Zn-dependent protease